MIMSNSITNIASICNLAIAICYQAIQTRQLQHTGTHVRQQSQLEPSSCKLCSNPGMYSISSAAGRPLPIRQISCVWRMWSPLALGLTMQQSACADRSPSFLLTELLPLSDRVSQCRAWNLGALTDGAPRVVTEASATTQSCSRLWRYRRSLRRQRRSRGCPGTAHIQVDLKS